MRKLTCILMLFVFNYVEAQNDLSGARFFVESDTLDYGMISYDGNGVRDFVVTNTGDEPLIVSRVQGSCGCLVLSWTIEPIARGKTGIITIKYETRKVGKINKTVSVFTNDAIEPVIVLRIIGTVLPEPDNNIQSVEPVPKN